MSIPTLSASTYIMGDFQIYSFFTAAEAQTQIDYLKAKIKQTRAKKRMSRSDGFDVYCWQKQIDTISAERWYKDFVLAQRRLAAAAVQS